MTVFRPAKVEAPPPAPQLYDDVCWPAYSQKQPSYSQVHPAVSMSSDKGMATCFHVVFHVLSLILSMIAITLAILIATGHISVPQEENQQPNIVNQPMLGKS